MSLQQRAVPALDRPAPASKDTLAAALFILVKESTAWLGAVTTLHEEKIYWRIRIIEALACAEHYLGTWHRHALQAYVRRSLEGVTPFREP